MNITIDLKDGVYYWTLKDKDEISTNWGESLGEVSEQIIRDQNKPISIPNKKWGYVKPVIGMENGLPIVMDSWNKKENNK